MGARKQYNAVVATGEYKDASGQTKKKWLNIGAVMKNDDGGQFLLLDRTFNPAGMPVDPKYGHGPGMVSFFDPDNNRSSPAPSRAAPAPRQAPLNDEDDIPF